MGKEELETFRVYIAEYQTKLTKKYKARKRWIPPNPNHILAVIPGTILEILVKKNQDVKAGETLLILEAMKMANNITMPFDGAIMSINVEKGDMVTKNHIMIELKPK
ncbi:MAG: biotin/lipoyl-binding protein [Cyclobacteriaceae bacterium]|nr:biotin/lipoyl-binding protein [Cyclobacteriaceae bacterium]